MRISDTERQRTIDELRRHCAAGRIDVDEYAQRIEKVMSAATLEELDAVLLDLPMLRIADPSKPGEGRPGSWFEPKALSGAGAGRGRFVAAATVLLTVLVVVSAAVLLALVSWGWAAVLLGGWVAGLMQGAFLRRRPRS